MLFENAIAPCPWTLPSIASCFTGLYPTAHNTNESISLPGATRTTPIYVVKLPEELTTLAEALNAAGYTTAALSANPYIRARNGFAQGFDHFDDSFARNTTPGSTVNDAALAWLDQRDRSRPFFLYLHYMDVHGPYITADLRHVEPLVSAVRGSSRRTTVPGLRQDFRDAIPRYEKLPGHSELFDCVEYWSAIYTAGVLQMDEHLQQLRCALQERTIWDDCYIVLASDHGEALWENGLWYHGDSAHHNQLHVPLILRWPGHLPAGKRVRAGVSLIDLMPTLLDQLGAEPPPDVQGISLVPMLAGKVIDERPLLSEAVKERPYQKAITHGRWKLLGDLQTGRWELFDHALDPWDQHDLAAQQSERVKSMNRDLCELLRKNREVCVAITPQRSELGEEDLERLRALGYLTDEEQPTTREARPD